MSFQNRIKNSRNSDRVRGHGLPRHEHGSGRSFNGRRITKPIHRGPLMVNAPRSPYTIAKSIHNVKNFPWKHDLLEDSIRAAGVPGLEIGSKLFISNLDHRVTNDDIRELFSELGELKRYAIHYDKNGRPSGSAEVVYTRRSDAFTALKRYNNVQLDGKPMRIEILNDGSEMPVSARVNVTGFNGNKRRTVVMPGFGQTGMPAISRGFGSRRPGGFNSRGRGQARHIQGDGRVEGRGQARHIQGDGRVEGHRSRGQGRGRKPTIQKSADDLDKELENYHAEAMQIS